MDEIPKVKNFPVWCGRCDKKFDSHKNRIESMKLLDSHMQKAHPDYHKEED